VTRRFCCDGESLGGRPGVGRGRNPLSPFCRYVSAHRNTELTEALTVRATADRVLPALSNRMACRRRRSSCGAVPGGLMPPSIVKESTLFHYL